MTAGNRWRRAHCPKERKARSASMSSRRAQCQKDGRHKRCRGGAAPNSEAASAPSDGSKSAPALPGFVWDEAKQRYFRATPAHSHLHSQATPPTAARDDAQGFQAASSQQTRGSTASLSSSLLSACMRPRAVQPLPLLPMLRECVARAPLPLNSFHWALAKRQSVQGCKHAAYFSRSVVLFSDQSVSVLHLPARPPAHGQPAAAAPSNQVLQLPSNSLSSSALNVTAAFHSSDKHSWLKPGTCMHVAVLAPHSQHAAAAAAVTIMTCHSAPNGMTPLSVQSSFSIGARQPCAWLGRGSSHPTLDWDKPVCYVAGGGGGRCVAALELEPAMAGRPAQEWRMPNGMAVSCMSLWAGPAANHGSLMFCGGSSGDAVSIDPRSPRALVHPDIRHVTQCGWPGDCHIVCGHVGGSVCVWDMRFTKNAVSTTAPEREVFSLWSLSVSANAALALFTKNDCATLLDLSSFRSQRFETQAAAVGQGALEVASRIGSQGEGCAVFDNAFVAWDSHQAWAWQATCG